MTTAYVTTGLNHIWAFAR